MSFFILVKNHPPRRPLDAFCASVEPQFRQPRDITVGDVHILLFGDQSGAGPAYFEAPNGDFIAVFGSLIYKGDAVPAALPSLLSDFRLDSFEWKGLVGTHTILIHKDGRLHVFGDGLGACRLYSNREGSIWSDSFMAVLELCAPRVFDIQACYEYVYNGAVFGSRTLVEEVAALPANTILSVAGDETKILHRRNPIANEVPDVPQTLDAIADYHCARLEQIFEPIARNYGDRIRLSFSGGFDSRLMLAMLIEHGAKPTLFVYGDEDDEDVRIARIISKAEGLSLECIDKGATASLDLDAFIEETEKNLFAFDGWKVETPLFDFGADRKDRLKRHVDGQVPLNGSLGEIYRNFFYMPDRRSSTAAVVSTFYSPYDPRSLTDRFNEQGYRSAMGAAMREAIGAESDELARSQVEELYPKFRGRFWTGRDAQINQRFGPMFFPYLEPAAISNTAKIPIRFKDLGYLQGRMIAHVNPALTAYPSDYGFALDGPRPLKYRLKTFLSTQRPAALRKLSFRLKNRARQPLDKPLTPPYLSRVIDLEFPIMRALFNIERVNSANQYGLIATLEYLGQRYNLRVPED